VSVSEGILSHVSIVCGQQHFATIIIIIPNFTPSFYAQMLP